MDISGETNISTGWMSRFDISAQTKRRIVLYGNVLDWVLEGQETLPLTEWLLRQLRDRYGVQRIVRYNNCEPPRIIFWGGAETERAQEEFESLLQGPPRDSADPANAFSHLSELLRQSGPRAAVIVENTEHRLSEPSTAMAASSEAVWLRQLARETGEGNLAIHLYTSELQIPRDFVADEPDAVLILVPTPNYSERRQFFGRLPETAALLNTREGEAAVTSERLARVTEGYRLRELDQLRTLAESQEPGIDIYALLSRFRHGRKVDYWSDLKISEIRRQLHQQVKGQKDAIKQVARRMLMAKHQIPFLIDDSVRTPAMVLFFVGATGVGKTLMARSICKAITGTEENLKRIDMSEYQREHTDQRLIGSPPGYVGFLEGGQLTRWVLEKPHSVVLFDEIEKAHERILDIFLQILDGARLTDGKGQTVDFSEMILIFTSNIGVAEAMQSRLDRSDREAVERHYSEQVEHFFNEELERPEIFNRLKSGIVAFNYIGDDIARPVLETRLRQIAKGVLHRTQGALQIHFDSSDPGCLQVVDKLLEKAGYVDYGLRDINNILLEEVGGAVAELLDDETSRRRRDWRFRWNATDEVVELEPFSPEVAG
jgi:hypothetical protein